MNRLSATFLAYWNDKVVGYFTLINDSIVAEAVSESYREPSWTYRKYPAIKIARMARHRDFDNKGIGMLMLLRIFVITLHVSQFTGCRIITVDSKTGAVEWYRKKGFTLAQMRPRDDFCAALHGLPLVCFARRDAFPQNTRRFFIKNYLVKYMPDIDQFIHQSRSPPPQHSDECFCQSLSR